MNNIKALVDVIFNVPGATLPPTGFFSGRALLLFSFILLLLLLLLAVMKISSALRKAKNEDRHVDNMMQLQKKNEELTRQLEEIKDSNNRRNNYISSLFSAMDNGVVLFETDRSIILFNESAKQLAHIDSRCFFYPEDIQNNSVVASVFRKFDDVLKERKPFTLKLKNQDGRDLEIGVSPVLSKYRDGALLGVLVIMKDITEREKIERIRKEFISNVSHEFRTPLTLISGFIETLKMWEDLPSKDRNRSLEILEIETGRLSKLISELLLLSEIEHKIDNTSPVPIDVAKSIDQGIESLRNFAETKHQKIEKNIRLHFPLLYGNESWFYHAFRNIMENAIKYTPEGGCITVDAEADDSFLRISIRDTGIGIPEEEHEKIFERFYRVEKARSSKSGGSGIGLAIVKDIMSLFGGYIEVKSKPGHGSTFTLVFPVRGEPESKENVEAEPSPPRK
jgi:two-component system phosphate regulon sensor histidine kinase PhoR